MPPPPPCLFAQLHQKLCQFLGIIGLLLQRVGVAKTFAPKVNGVDLIASEPQIPVVAVDAAEDLIFQQGEGGAQELLRSEDAVSIEPGLVAGVDAVEVEKLCLSIHIQHICMVSHIKPVRLMEGRGKFGQKVVNQPPQINLDLPESKAQPSSNIETGLNQFAHAASGLTSILPAIGVSNMGNIRFVLAAAVLFLARIMHGPRKMDEKPIYSMH
jgi:hypothetical protein